MGHKQRTALKSECKYREYFLIAQIFEKNNAIFAVFVAVLYTYLRRNAVWNARKRKVSNKLGAALTYAYL